MRQWPGGTYGWMATGNRATLLELNNEDQGIRWFSRQGYVEYGDGVVMVWVGGTLLGQYDPADRASRDLLLLAIASGPKVHLGRLADAFGISSETLRILRRQREAEGLSAVLGRPSPGRQEKLTPKLRTKIKGLLDDGLTIQAIQKRLKGKLSMATIGRVRKDWAHARAARSTPDLISNDETGHAQPRLLADERDRKATEIADSTADDISAISSPEQAEASDLVPASATPSETADGGASAGRALRSCAPSSERHLQHAGAWIMLALLFADGLYKQAQEAIAKPFARARAKLKLSEADLYLAIDAVVVALAIGERSVEGVRRLETPSGPALLRASRVPSPAWIRQRLSSAAQDGGGFSFHAGVAAQVLARASERTAEPRPVVFYVDNHLRPYTGKETIRKGWRMQDHRARPGISDYYLHDEDGRPVMRVDVPEHDHLTDWVRPLAAGVREALGEQERFLLAFDRGGAFPQHLADLRDASFEVLTYERKPYSTYAPSTFTTSFMDEEEKVLVFDTRANLGKGRGRVRRIALRFESGQQVNLLTTSDLDAKSLYSIARHRWRQENGFKHGNERWGINQLDGRRTTPYPPDAIIPNPARTRLDASIRAARQAEGKARNTLAELDAKNPKYENAEHRVEEAAEYRKALEALRPSTPKKAAVKDTELADKLRRHEGEYKTFLDTIRVACANAESDLALLLAPQLPRPAEAKKVLANLFRAPATIRVRRDSIDVNLAPAATSAERDALGTLLADLTRRSLPLPRDSKARRLSLRLQT